MDIGWRGPSAADSIVVCIVLNYGDASISGYDNNIVDFGVRPVVSIPASGAPAGLKTALGINN